MHHMLKMGRGYEGVMATKALAIRLTGAGINEAAYNFVPEKTDAFV